MRLLIAVLIVPVVAGCAFAGENAAPSSHLVFDDHFEGDILINEVRVPKDGEAMYTYYETLGWRGKAAGYAGIQAHPKAHNYIFSIWDHKEHTAPIKAIHHGPGTLTQKFGGEGTGLKSWNFELGWETDTWYTLVARCWPVGDHTHHGYWARDGKTGKWTHLVTMDVAARDAYYRGGTDAFIEDWLETGKNARTSHLRGGWKRKRSGEWHAFGSARYSVNHWDLEKGKRSFNFRTSWNGGVAKDEGGEFYFMTAGGAETKPTTENPSTHSIKRTAEEPDFAPVKITSARVTAGGDGEIVVSWEIDPKSAPQFAFTITGAENGAAQDGARLRLEKIEPQARSAAVKLPESLAPSSVSVRLQCRDIFDRPSKITPVK